jgi:2-oxoisovalerate dehydrogenase E2 component (dihydrolipoyl transacylase)
MSVRVVKLPDIGEGVAEAEVVEWHVAEGDDVAEDQLIAAVMTDKATVEIPSPVAGKIVELGAEVGAKLAVGSPLFTIAAEGGAGKNPGAEETQPAVEDAGAQAHPVASEEAVPVEAPQKAPQPNARPGSAHAAAARAPARPAGPPRAAGEKPLASPAVRGRALQAGVDLRQVPGSGPAGRITHEDLDAFVAGGATASRAVTGVPDESIEEIKVVGLRRRIAERMADSKRRVAHFAYVEEVDVTGLEDLRASLNASAADNRAKLTPLPFLVKAVVIAVRAFPQMNALYDDEADVIIRYGGVHAGIATQTSSGLMVPVVRHAEARDLWDCALEIKRVSTAARDGSALREELMGSTITVTSLGEFGGIASTPVVNRPEVAIIGVNKIAVRPVWQDNAFVPRKVMNLSSSFDHRVVDGYDAARFIHRIKSLLETPATMFIEA